MSIYSKTIGWTKLGKTEMIDAALNTLDQNLAARDLGIWNWQWNTRARQLNLASEELIHSRLEATYATQQSEMYHALNQMLKSLVPKDQDKQYAQALEYADTDDKINGIIGTMVDFGMSGFTVASGTPKSEKKIAKWNRSQRIYNLLLEMWNTAAACDNVVIMQKRGNLSLLPLPNLKIIPTHSVDKNGNKQFRTFLKVPQEIKDFIKKNLQKYGSNPQLKKEKLAGIPDKWIDAVQHPLKTQSDPVHPNGGYVELGNDIDEQIFIINAKGIEDRLIIPSMITVFPSIALRSFLQDGEFSIAYLIKYFIHQIRMGKKVEGRDLKQMLRYGGISKEDRDEIESRYRTKLDKVILEVTDQYLEHVFHFPGNEVDFGKRYATPDERIDWWARISRQIIVGDRGSYSGGLIYLKGYSRKIARFRTLFAQFLEDLYLISLGDADAEVQWDEHYMKEPRQKLREIQIMTQRGMSMKTACNILGYSWKKWVTDREQTISPDILKLKGTDEEWKYWQEIEIPFFEPNQGMLTESSPGGRPPTSDNQTDDSLRESEPRPEVIEGVDLGEG